MIIKNYIFFHIHNNQYFQCSQGIYGTEGRYYETLERCARYITKEFLCLGFVVEEETVFIKWKRVQEHNSYER